MDRRAVVVVRPPSMDPSTQVEATQSIFQRVAFTDTQWSSGASDGFQCWDYTAALAPNNSVKTESNTSLMTSQAGKPLYS
uniref:HDC06364 n=1 Tax=Drosophila melanogaster TaxID=7227 RepID=Q6IGG3_DROME|nr:TPA_inf: HDC06364 [Drosophila melanogaster]